MCKIKEYHRIIRNFAEEKSSTIIENTGADRAACLMSAIFDYSENLYLFSGELGRKLTSEKEYFESLEKFLCNDSKSLTVLLENNPEEDDRSDALKLVLEKAKTRDNINVKVLGNESKSVFEDYKKRNEGNSFHFAIADGRIFRYEYDPQNYKASASFNEPEMVSVLANVFNLFYEKGVELN